MDGKQLAEAMRQKAAEFGKLCAGLDESTASRAPEGRWSPKEIVSHLLGAEGGGLTAGFKMFLEQNNPLMGHHPADPCYSENRAHTTFKQLLEEFDKEYGAAANFVAGLSPEQLSTKAHVPELKESPMGEYPTLEAFVGGIADYHLGFHIDHMREILQGLGVTPKS